jgi:hypothetical protein
VYDPPQGFDSATRYGDHAASVNERKVLRHQDRRAVAAPPPFFCSQAETFGNRIEHDVAVRAEKVIRVLDWPAAEALAEKRPSAAMTKVELA